MRRVGDSMATGLGEACPANRAQDYTVDVGEADCFVVVDAVAAVVWAEGFAGTACEYSLVAIPVALQ